MFVAGNAVWVDVNSDYNEDTDPELVTDLKAINNSLFNLFSCPLGSRPFERGYGCMLMWYLMEPADSTTSGDLQVSLLESIAAWEKRIVVDRARTSVTLSDDGAGFSINLFYTINKSLLRARYQYIARRNQ